MKIKPPTARLFFGDAERDFALTPDLIVELERVSDAGIGAIFKRLASSGFKHADVLHTIRLALIGGGETPQVAASLVHVYAANRPLAEAMPVALAVLETCFFGQPSKDEADASA